MPERIVTDAERVRSCRSLWYSRFGKPPSFGEICRVTSLSLERVRAVYGQTSVAPTRPARDPRPNRPNRPVRPALVELDRPRHRRPAKPSTAIETLTCADCGQAWDRTVKRGSKPRVCPDCKAA